MKSINELKEITREFCKKKNALNEQKLELQREETQLQLNLYEVENKNFIEDCYKEMELRATKGLGNAYCQYRFPKEYDYKQIDDFCKITIAYFKSLGFRVDFELTYDSNFKRNKDVLTGVQFRLDWGSDIFDYNERVRYINEKIKELNSIYKETGEISDTYHTFDELYYHRCVLFSLICNQNNHIAWKSKKHSTGDMYDNMFIVGVNTPYGQITYHYNLKFWDMFKVPELDNAPEWDDSTPADCIERMRIWSDNIK